MKDTSVAISETDQVPWGRDALNLWPLDQGCTYLNHGAFGVTSNTVLDRAEHLRRLIDRQPALFLREQLPDRLRQSAAAVGRFLGGDGDDIVFVDNATTGVNAVLRSLMLLPGDEVVTTDHAYGAVLRTLEFVCERAGARLLFAHVPFPIRDPGEATDAIMSRVTPRTRLVVVDHITSMTALKLPVHEIVHECEDRGIPVLVDGAHAPGSVPVHLNDLGAAWYVGNAHKWLGAPRGCGFIWTHPDRQSSLRPTTISHYVGEGYIRAFDWPGTKDFTPYLGLMDAIEFRARWGEKEIYHYCRTLVRDAANMLADAWGTERGASDRTTAFMTTVEWPGAEKATPKNAEALQLRLRHEFNIEVEVKPFADRLWIRFCAYIYNDMADYEKLAQVGRTFM